MRVKIKENAAEIYKKNMKASGNGNGSKIVLSNSWIGELEALSGEWLRVDTERLHESCFYTEKISTEQYEKCVAKIKSSFKETSGNHERLTNLVTTSLSLSGFRFDLEYIEAIQGDARKGLARCSRCQSVCSDDDKCPKCKTPKHLVSFDPFLAEQQRLYVKEKIENKEETIYPEKMLELFLLKN